MLHQIAQDVFQIYLMPRNSINYYIIEGVLVDSGIRNSYNTIRRALKQIRVYQHVLTHAHADHQGCSDLICTEFSIPLICHPSEVIKTETGLVTNNCPNPKNLITKLQQKYWAVC